MIIVIGQGIIQSRRMARLQKVVAEESMKYSSRVPVSCSWRLETATFFFAAHRNRRSRQIIGRV